jgi:hypothetical protein
MVAQDDGGVCCRRPSDVTAPRWNSSAASVKV